MNRIRWEYLVDDFTKDGSSCVQRRLTYLGISECWELVAIEPTSFGYRLFMKRPSAYQDKDKT